MADIGYNDQDFWIIFFVFGGIGILVSGLLFFIQDLRARRNQTAQIKSRQKPYPFIAHIMALESHPALCFVFGIFVGFAAMAATILLIFY